MEKVIGSNGLKKMLLYFSETIKESLGARDCYFVDSLKEHVLTPILQQVYSEIVPYVWMAAAIIFVLLALTLVTLIMQMAIFWRVSGFLGGAGTPS